MIRGRNATHGALKKHSHLTRRPMQEVLARAVEEERRRLYLERLNADYAALKKDSKIQAELRKEWEIWDTTLMDGLEDL